MKKVLYVIVFAFTMSSAAAAADECVADTPGLLFASCAGQSSAELALNPEDTVIARPDLPSSASGLIVTGSYTSGDRHEPEGLYIGKGKVLDPYIQGWDGLALIDRAGRLSLHHVERVTKDGERWNLRRRLARLAFVSRTKAEKWSALQSHLLIVDGRVDTKPRDGARRFRRRVLFSLADGSYGVWQSQVPLTLHDATVDVAERFAPVMALNLDMGSHDFCERFESGKTMQCGLLDLDQTGILSNVIVFSQEPRKLSQKAH